MTEEDRDIQRTLKVLRHAEKTGDGLGEDGGKQASLFRTRYNWTCTPVLWHGGSQDANRLLNSVDNRRKQRAQN